METNFYEASTFYIDRERKFQSSMPAHHYHNGYEIFYLVSGDICYFIDDKAYQAVSGALLIIDMNEIHKLVNSSGASFERVTLEFKKDFLDDLFPCGLTVDVMSSFSRGRPFVKLSGQEMSFVERLLDQMIHEFTKMPEGYEPNLKTLLFQLLLFIHRKMSASPAADQTAVNSIHKKTFEIVDYVNRHYDEKLTIEQISSRFYISPSHFCKTFRKSTGFTFTEYLNNVRIKEAKVLLTGGSDKVANIADTVGFESLTHFGRIFKEFTGLSPLKYRQQYKTF
ncbi:AraC family transcriptional regulator [Paenibacillus sp. HJL G12]|uniref:AraC family transcriptional regulator n=1 Tax=Paenibacillus dendrobii TaxID=2691084 RepID=A0A7X3IPZ8_9BACL|nr:AraC family transcriptional regulator [Paenibacillus dendrobii]MWV46785.1 AraC family transcriptional regulator [Paenibacillus dendrobii]